MERVGCALEAGEKAVEASQLSVHELEERLEQAKVREVQGRLCLCSVPLCVGRAVQAQQG